MSEIEMSEPNLEIEKKLKKLEKLSDALLYLTCFTVAVMLLLVGVAYTTTDPELYDNLRNPIIILGFMGLCMDILAYRADKHLTTIWNEHYCGEN